MKTISVLLKHENKHYMLKNLLLLKMTARLKTSMIWPSRNFLLYNETIIKIKINERINNLKKYYVSPPLWGYIQSVQNITI